MTGISYIVTGAHTTLGHSTSATTTSVTPSAVAFPQPNPLPSNRPTAPKRNAPTPCNTMSRTESDLLEAMGVLLAAEVMFSVSMVVVASLPRPIHPPRDAAEWLRRAAAILRGANGLIRVFRVSHAVVLMTMAVGACLFAPTDRLAWLVRWGVLVYLDATLIAPLPVDPRTHETSTTDALYAVATPIAVAVLLFSDIGGVGTYLTTDPSQPESVAWAAWRIAVAVFVYGRIATFSALAMVLWVIPKLVARGFDAALRMEPGVRRRVG